MSALEQMIHEEYKQTEVGIIPNDWSVESVKSICKEIFLGLTSKVDYVEHGGMPLIRATDIAAGVLSFDKVRTISLKQHKKLTQYRRAKKGGVLVSKSGSLGVCALVDVDREFSIYESIIVLQPTAKLDSIYLLSLLRAEETQFRMIGEKVGSGVAHLNIEMFRKLSIPLPSCKQEQIKIGQVINDVSALLTELDTLIAKKQAIKTATMQQLLTGKTRLPQFATYTEGAIQGKSKGTKNSELGKIPEDWDVAPAREAIEFFGGYGFSSRLSSESGVKWLKIANVGLNEVKWDADSYLPENLLNSFKSYSLKDNDVVMALTRPLLGDKLKIAKITNADLPALLNQRVAKLIAKRSNCLNYIFYVVQRAEFIAQMNLAMAGTDPPNIGTTALGSINIVLPPAEEQAAIATILSDMDNEIQTLEQRLTKTRQIKQGMMQQLLTGRTRLPY